MKQLRMSEAMQRMCPVRPDQTCRGEKCMAWRWTTEPLPRRAHVVADDGRHRPSGIPSDWEFEPADREEGEPAQWIEPLRSARLRSFGHCGLAGMPQW